MAQEAVGLLRCAWMRPPVHECCPPDPSGRQQGPVTHLVQSQSLCSKDTRLLLVSAVTPSSGSLGGPALLPTPEYIPEQKEK